MQVASPGDSFKAFCHKDRVVGLWVKGGMDAEGFLTIRQDGMSIQ